MKILAFFQKSNVSWQEQKMAFISENPFSHVVPNSEHFFVTLCLTVWCIAILSPHVLFIHSGNFRMFWLFIESCMGANFDHILMLPYGAVLLKETSFGSTSVFRGKIPQAEFDIEVHDPQILDIARKCVIIAQPHPVLCGGLLLTWCNFNLRMHKWLHPS